MRTAVVSRGPGAPVAQRLLQDAQVAAASDAVSREPAPFDS